MRRIAKERVASLDITTRAAASVLEPIVEVRLPASERRCRCSRSAARLSPSGLGAASMRSSRRCAARCDDSPVVRIELAH
jgi:hypothetical protein